MEADMEIVERRSMKIGLLADLFLPHVSGVTRHLELCLRHFTRRGHDCRLFTFGPRLESDGDQVVRTPALPFRFPYGKQELEIPWKHGKRALRQMQGSDVLHIHHPLGPSSRLISWARALGIPTLVTLHTRYDLHLRAHSPRFLRSLAERLLSRRLGSTIKTCEQVIVPSRAVLECLPIPEADRARMAVVPNGVDLETIRSAVPADRRELGFSRDEVLFVHTGRLAPEKDLEMLLDAFAVVCDRCRQRLGLLIVGDGPSRSGLEEQARKRDLPVHFTGIVNPRRVVEFCKMADVFVTPSSSEVHPLSVMEALAASLPVVGFAVPGLREIVTDGRNGVLVSPGFRNLVRALMRLVEEQPMRRRLATAARASGLEFSAERTADRLLDCYVAVRAGQDRGLETPEQGCPA